MDPAVEALARRALDAGSSAGEVRSAGPDGPVLTVRGRRLAGGGLWLVLEDVSELRRLQRIRTEFIDNLSHELRTPLTTVSLLSETLQREAETAGDTIPAKMRERIAKIEVETGHLVQMVNELLDLVRIESGGDAAARRRCRPGSPRRRRGGAPSAVRRAPGRHAAGRRTADLPTRTWRRRQARPGGRQPGPQRREVQPGRR